MTTISIRIESIEIGERHRRILGDIDGLAESIRTLGLLQPIVITPDKRLVAGRRRIEAVRKLGKTHVDAHVTHELSDAVALLKAERDENECRLEPAPSEKASLGLMLEELERPRAEERRAQAPGQPQGIKKRSSPNFGDEYDRHAGEVTEIVGKAVGMSRTTYMRAKAVVEASRNETLPPETRAIAVDCVEQMDATGKITPAYNRVAPLIGFSPSKQPQEKDPTEPYNPATARQRQLANAQKDRLIRAVSTINGICRGLRELNVPMAVCVCSPDDIEAWAEQASDCARVLKDLQKNLRQHLIRSNGNG